mmetsp:Transcript_10356/g.14614  ORF Transcript_10356/g.14614 Transcript_10356/m.14614 type:complete len:119 (+) Transcript_10356:152-508(+)
MKFSSSSLISILMMVAMLVSSSTTADAARQSSLRGLQETTDPESVVTTDATDDGIQEVPLDEDGDEPMLFDKIGYDEEGEAFNDDEVHAEEIDETVYDTYMESGGEEYDTDMDEPDTA